MLLFFFLEPTLNQEEVFRGLVNLGKVLNVSSHPYLYPLGVSELKVI